MSELEMAKINFSVKLLAFSFFVIIFGFNAVQQYVTVFFVKEGISTVGFSSLIIIYALFSLSSPIAGAFVNKYGPKNAMLIASLFYGFFILSLLSGSVLLVYLSSALLGVAAAFLWNGQNIYLLRTAGDSPGKCAGLFMTSISLSTGLGILTIWYLQHYFTLNQIFLAFSFFPFLGFMLMLGLPAVAPAPVPNKLVLMRKSLTSITALQFSFLWFGMAFVYGLAVGFLPVDIKSQLGIQFVGPLSALFYVIPLLFSYSAGNISDKVGRKVIVIVGLALAGIGLILLLVGQSLWIMVIGILCLTIYYSVMRTITYALVGDISTQSNLSSLTSLMWAIQNIGTIVALVIPLFVLEEKVYLISLLFVAATSVVLYPTLKHSLPETKSLIEREMKIAPEEMNQSTTSVSR